MLLPHRYARRSPAAIRRRIVLTETLTHDAAPGMLSHRGRSLAGSVAISLAGFEEAPELGDGRVQPAVPVEAPPARPALEPAPLPDGPLRRPDERAELL